MILKIQAYNIDPHQSFENVGIVQNIYFIYENHDTTYVWKKTDAKFSHFTCNPLIRQISRYHMYFAVGCNCCIVFSTSHYSEKVVRNFTFLLIICINYFALNIVSYETLQIVIFLRTFMKCYSHIFSSFLVKKLISR